MDTKEVHSQPRDVSKAKRTMMKDGYAVQVAQMRRDRLMVTYEFHNDRPEDHIGWIINTAKDYNMVCHGVQTKGENRGTVFLQHNSIIE